jgi:hypothetical protein
VVPAVETLGQSWQGKRLGGPGEAVTPALNSVRECQGLRFAGHKGPRQGAGHSVPGRRTLGNAGPGLPDHRNYLKRIQKPRLLKEKMSLFYEVKYVLHFPRL